MTPALLLIPFAAPVAAGCVVGGWCWLRDRHQMARAFAHGRAEGVTRLPLRPVSVSVGDDAA